MFDGITIQNLLSKHPETLNVYIDGLAASMASVIAMAGDKVVMPENAMMMIHKPWGISGGNAREMRDYADLLDKVEAVLIPAYVSKTGKTSEELAPMLENETWLNGCECVEMGFADELAPAVTMMARLESKRAEEFEDMPQSLKNMIMSPQASTPQGVSAEQQRINGIKDMFASFGGRHQTLPASCIEDASCHVDQAKDNLLAALGKESISTGRNAAKSHIYPHNDNITGDAIRQQLYARLGHEKAERDNSYAMISLFDMAR